MPDFGTDVAARLQYLLEQNTQAIDAKSYTIWMIYIPYDMEAAESYRNISSAEGQDIPVFEVTPKMLTANDFTFAGRTWTYDATPHTLTYGEDIFINPGVLVGAEAESGQLPGNVRIMFRKESIRYYPGIYFGRQQQLCDDCRFKRHKGSVYGSKARSGNRLYRYDGTQIRI